jgi:hypothetical protein
MGERIGNIIAMFFIVFIALIFINIQLQGQGFFTADFGPLEQLLFYGSLLFGVIPAFIRAATGRRNLGRLADLFGSVVFIVAASYLLVTFPFDFSSLLSLLPFAVSTNASWLNDLFRALFELAIFISAITLVYNAILYIAVRKELRARGVATSP